MDKGWLAEKTDILMHENSWVLAIAAGGPVSFLLLFAALQGKTGHGPGPELAVLFSIGIPTLLVHLFCPIALVVTAIRRRGKKVPVGLAVFVGLGYYIFLLLWQILLQSF